MRKLFVLTAILFIAPPAYSALTISLNDTGTTVELIASGRPNGGYIAMVIEAPGLLTNFVDGPEAPTFSLFDTVTINGDSGELRCFPPSPNYFDGVWLIADFSAPVPVWVSAYKGFPLGGGEFDWFLQDRIQVPEPTTIALLTLGGIFLLRRR